MKENSNYLYSYPDDILNGYKNIPTIVGILNNNGPNKLTNDNNSLNGLYNKVIIEILNIEENSLYSKYIQKFNSIINTNFSKNGVSVGVLHEAGTITMETLPQFVYPIVEYIHEFQPDCIVASDRGARFIGLAVKLLYQRLYGRLPTFDGTVRFRKVSRKATDKHNRKMLSGVVDETLEYGRNGRILFLDDWIASGGTQDMVSRLIYELGKGKIDLKYGVLVGDGGNVSGKQSNGCTGFIGAVEWHDNSEKIGVDYDDNMSPYVVNSDISRYYRARLISGTNRFLESLRSDLKRLKK